jgi:hypothetical protein
MRLATESGQHRLVATRWPASAATPSRRTSLPLLEPITVLPRVWPSIHLAGGEWHGAQAFWSRSLSVQEELTSSAACAQRPASRPFRHALGGAKLRPANSGDALRLGRHPDPAEVIRLTADASFCERKSNEQQRFRCCQGRGGRHVVGSHRRAHHWLPARIHRGPQRLDVYGPIAWRRTDGSQPTSRTNCSIPGAHKQHDARLADWQGGRHVG